MSFSLYSALPPSKSEKNSEEPVKKPTSSIPSLYASLPLPEAPPPKEPTTVEEPTAKPEGWSVFNKFRPVVRRPTIQAKPKLNKSVIPAGATLVSTKTITKEEKEQENNVQSVHITTKVVDNIDLGAIPLLSSSDDVNGFRAVQKTKKKGKKGKNNNNNNSNNQPQPIVFNMMEAYDPYRPNDYEQYKEERNELREQQRKKREWERQNRSKSDSRSRSRSYSRSPSRSPSPHYPRSPSPRDHEEPTAPKINLQETADDAYMRRVMLSQQKPPLKEDTRMEEAAQLHPAQDIARKVLAKYGWQEGQGLGRDEDGIREALQVQAIGVGLGKIVNPKTPKIPEKPVKQESKVILLTNMVGPGEVDDMLQEETADECSKYGKVERCLIFEVPHGQIQDDRAVRIFVKFSQIEEARKAIHDLNGRFFGGRIVTASFFDDTRFNKLDLAPTAEEFQQ